MVALLAVVRVFFAFLKATRLKPKHTSIQPPWQNGIAERWVGGCRRDSRKSREGHAESPDVSKPTLARSDGARESTLEVDSVIAISGELAYACRADLSLVRLGSAVPQIAGKGEGVPSFVKIHDCGDRNGGPASDAAVSVQPSG